MPQPIRKLSLQQFQALVQSTRLHRKITSVHVHHTWRPTRSQFEGLRTVEAMRRFHMNTMGMSDIAQHLTLDPEGWLWTGRPWNKSPGSARGHNGSPQEGPFMIEMVGDFDIGRDPFDGPQRAAAARVVAGLLVKHGLSSREVRFHNEFSSKSCPGTSIDQDTFREEVDAARRELLAARETDVEGEDGAGDGARPFAPRFYTAFGVDVEIPEEEVVDDGELTYDDEGPWTTDAADAAVDPSSRGGGSDRLPDLDQKGLCRLRRHVVNLSMGQLSEDDFTTTPEELDKIFDEDLPRWWREQDSEDRPLRVLVWAHGGLVSERKALQTALRDLDFWLDNGIYPLFVVWETAWHEILVQQTLGARAAATDWILETSLRPLVRPLWSGIKESAELASRSDLGDGVPGGMYQLGQKLKAFAAAHEEDGGRFELHAAGHSAGSILLSHFAPVLGRGRDALPLATLSFLAPAVRIDLFKAKVASKVGTGDDDFVRKFLLFTMEKPWEKGDSVAFIYRKSLLYFVSRACEPRRKTEILGLEESLRKDRYVMDLLRGPHAEVVWSKSSGAHGPSASQAITHGGFDEDPATMNSLALRILGLDRDFPPRPHPGPWPDEAVARGPGWPESGWPESGWPESGWPESGSPEWVPPATRPVAGPAPSSSATRPAAPSVVPAASGRRVALCVGIDDYAKGPLDGCVADARLWARSLGSLGFEIRKLHDHEATRGAILAEIERLVRDARAGDTVVFQFSGHGSQVEDFSGDEEGDDFDEALVPHDVERVGLVLDDELGALYDLVADGVNLTLFMDCCHSGTNSRFRPAARARGEGLRPRYLPATPQVVEIQRRRAASVRPQRRAPRHPEIHFAAATDDQFAYEENGQGWFTRAAAGRLVEAVHAGQTHGQFLDAVRRQLPTRLDQDPMLWPGDPQGVLLAARHRATSPSAPHSDAAARLDRFLRGLDELIDELRGG